MSTLDNIKVKSVKRFVTGSFVLMGLFIVLTYGFAALALHLGKAFDSIVDISVLIWSLAFFLLLVLGGFLWLMKRLYKKLYGTSNSKNNVLFLKMFRLDTNSKYNLLVASAIKSNNGEVELIMYQIKRIPE